MAGAGRQQRQLVDVRPDHRVCEIEVVARQQVEQPGAVRAAEQPRNRGMRDVAVDEQHGAVDFHRDAQREVERRERLAFGRQRGGHHHQVAVAHARARLSQRIADDRPLQHAEFVGDLRFRRVGRHEAAGLELREIEIDVALDPVGRALRRDVRVGEWIRMCGARRPGMVRRRACIERAHDRLGRGRRIRRPRFHALRELGSRTLQLFQALGRLLDQAHRGILTRHVPSVPQWRTLP